MEDGEVKEAGFSLVEVVIAMVLLGVIAVALLPALWQGIMYASQQSSVASATRLLNALVEDGRADASCASILAIDDPRVPAPTDGQGNELSVSFVGGTPACTSSSAVSFTVQVVDSVGTVLARSSAIVYVR